MIPRPPTERIRLRRAPNINLRNALFSLKRRREAGRAWQCAPPWCPPCPQPIPRPTLQPPTHAWGWLPPLTTTPYRTPWQPSFPQTPTYSPPHVSHAQSCLPGLLAFFYLFLYIFIPLNPHHFSNESSSLYFTQRFADSRRPFVCRTLIVFRINELHFPLYFDYIFLHKFRQWDDQKNYEASTSSTRINTNLLEVKCWKLGWKCSIDCM